MFNAIRSGDLYKLQQISVFMHPENCMLKTVNIVCNQLHSLMRMSMSTSRHRQNNNNTFHFISLKDLDFFKSFHREIFLRSDYRKSQLNPNPNWSNERKMLKNQDNCHKINGRNSSIVNGIWKQKVFTNECIYQIASMLGKNFSSQRSIHGSYTSEITICKNLLPL